MLTLLERLAYWLALGSLALAAGYYLLGHEFTLYTAAGMEKLWSSVFDAQADTMANFQGQFSGAEKVQLTILSMFVVSLCLFGLASRRH